MIGGLIAVFSEFDNGLYIPNDKTWASPRILHLSLTGDEISPTKAGKVFLDSFSLMMLSIMWKKGCGSVMYFSITMDVWFCAIPILTIDNTLINYPVDYASFTCIDVEIVKRDNKYYLSLMFHRFLFFSWGGGLFLPQKSGIMIALLKVNRVANAC